MPASRCCGHRGQRAAADPERPAAAGWCATSSSSARASSASASSTGWSRPSATARASSASSTTAVIRSCMISPACRAAARTISLPASGATAPTWRRGGVAVFGRIADAGDRPQLRQFIDVRPDPTSSASTCRTGLSSSRRYSVDQQRLRCRSRTGTRRQEDRGHDPRHPALVLLALSSAVAIAIKLDGPGPVLFRQKRFGFNNKLFEVYKFRTMRADMQDPPTSCAQRSARDARRRLPAPHQPRRAAADPQRAQGRDVAGRARPHASTPRRPTSTTTRLSRTMRRATASSPASPAGRRSTAGAAKPTRSTRSTAALSATSTTSTTGRSGSTSGSSR